MKLVAILKEIKIGLPDIPEGWSESVVSDEEKAEGFVKQYSAPMEGWDVNHLDSVSICKNEDNSYGIIVYISFGGFENYSETYKTLTSAYVKAIEIMNEISEDWDNGEH